MSVFSNPTRRIAAITAACAAVISLAGCAGTESKIDSINVNVSTAVKTQVAATDDEDAATFTVDENGDTVVRDQSLEEQPEVNLEDEEEFIEPLPPEETEEFSPQLDAPQSVSTIPDNISANQLQSAFEIDAETAQKIESLPESERRQAVYDYAEQSPLLDVDYENEVPTVISLYAGKMISVLGDGENIESQTLMFNTLEETKAAYEDLCSKYGEDRVILESTMESYADEGSVPDLSDEEWEELFANVNVEEVTYDGETFIEEGNDDVSVEEGLEDEIAAEDADDSPEEEVASDASEYDLVDVMDDSGAVKTVSVTDKEDIAFSDLESGTEIAEKFATTTIGTKSKNPGFAATNLPAAANLLEACTSDKPVTIAIVEPFGANAYHNATKHVKIDSKSGAVKCDKRLTVPYDKAKDYTYIYNKISYSSGAKIGTSNYKYWKDEDKDGHGTAVLSILAAGVPKGTKIVLIKPLKNTTFNLIACLKYARDRGAKVVNASWGASIPMDSSGAMSRGLYNALIEDYSKRNIILVAAAGNDNAKVKSTKTGSYPAALNKAVTVAAVDSSKKRAKFSNYGEQIDFVAPGVNMLVADNTSNKKYWVGSGTSFAAPCITACAANLASLHPERGKGYVISTMQCMSKDLGAKGRDKYYGCGFPVFSLWRIPFSITYSNLNGLKAPSRKTYNTTISTTLSAPKGSKKGYKFVGWYTKKTGGKKVTKIAKGSKGDIKLYARFQANTYKISFKANGGTSTMPAQKISYNKKVKLNANKFKRTGYTFTGWNTKANGKGKTYKNKASIKNLASSGTVTLYAMWKANTYKVAFNANGGKGKMSPQSFTYGKSAKLNANKFSRVGYKFIGWNTKANGTGTTYKNNASVKNVAAAGSVTLYAIWQSTSSPMPTTSTTPLPNSSIKRTIKIGWVALDSNKKMILRGSKYKKSESPVAYIWNNNEMIPVPKGSVAYLRNSRTGTAQALVIGDKINGCKDAFITTFQIT